MAQAEMSVGCPHCGSSITTDVGGNALGRGRDRLKGRRVGCPHCRTAFEVYYY